MHGSRQQVSAPTSDTRLQRTGTVPTGGNTRASSASNPWPWILGGGGLLAVIGLASGGGGSDQAVAPEPVAASSPAVAVPAPALPPVEPVVIRRADRHAELAVGAEGASGAMVYSVNCWAGVARSFSLAALDRCGAFDALARRVRMDPSEFAAEAAWFEAGAANERYLAAVKAGGVDTVAAGERHARVLELAGAEVLEPRTPRPPEPVTEATNEVAANAEVAEGQTSEVEAIPTTAPSAAPALDQSGFSEPGEGTTRG